MKFRTSPYTFLNGSMGRTIGGTLCSALWLVYSLGFCGLATSTGWSQQSPQDDLTVVLEPDQMTVEQPASETPAPAQAAPGTAYTASNAKLNTIFRVLAQKA